jgi:hypothetical protein
MCDTRGNLVKSDNVPMAVVAWRAVRYPEDIEALDQHPFLNCRANIFVRGSVPAVLHTIASFAVGQ